MKTFHYRWSWRLRSTPEALWPFISDTNQFNRDTGVPAIIHRPRGDRSTVRRTLSLKQFGVDVTWEEEPFEWVRPSRFGVVRRYSSGPLAQLRVLVNVRPISDASDTSGGSEVTYEIWAQPRN